MASSAFKSSSYLLNAFAKASNRSLSSASRGRGRSNRGAFTAPQTSLARADEWTEVIVKQTGEVYYWNERTDETTAIGEPKPGPEGRLVSQVEQQPMQRVPIGQSVGMGLGQMVLMGFGMTLGFILVGSVFGSMEGAEAISSLPAAEEQFSYTRNTPSVSISDDKFE